MSVDRSLHSGRIKKILYGCTVLYVTLEKECTADCSCLREGLRGKYLDLREGLRKYRTYGELKIQNILVMI